MTRSIVSQAHDFYDAVPYEVPVPDTSLFPTACPPRSVSS